MKPQQQPIDRIAVITVHGTGDTADDISGQKWWQRGSPFTSRFLEKLALAGVAADIVPHIWSGANSAAGREAAADTLAALIRECRKEYRGVHVIGHSHGGNVADTAADFVGWGNPRARARSHLSSVTTVGTPFFDSRTAPMKAAAGWAFLVLAFLCFFFLPIVLITGATMLFGRLGAGEGIASVSGGGGFVTDMALFIVYLLAVGIALRFMWRIASLGLRRIIRRKPRERSDASIMAVWHENDEAISFLRRLEEVPVEPFPAGSLFRGSRASAIGFGVLAVIVFAIAWPTLVVYSNRASASGDPLAFATGAVIAALLSTPIVFCAAFLGYRYIVGNLLETTARGWLNGRVGSALRGIAYGKDGDQDLCNVSTVSHMYVCKSVVLDGDVAERMRLAAAAAANALIEKYRWSLFSVASDAKTSLASVSTDALTWDSLIHTTYFDQPEVADLIADHVIAEARLRGEI